MHGNERKEVQIDVQTDAGRLPERNEVISTVLAPSK